VILGVINLPVDDPAGFIGSVLPWGTMVFCCHGITNLSRRARCSRSYCHSCLWAAISVGNPTAQSLSRWHYLLAVLILASSGCTSALPWSARNNPTGCRAEIEPRIGRRHAFTRR